MKMNMRNEKKRHIIFQEMKTHALDLKKNGKFHLQHSLPLPSRVDGLMPTLSALACNFICIFSAPSFIFAKIPKEEDSL